MLIYIWVCAAPFVEHFLFLSDKFVLNQEVSILKDQVISVILSNVISTLITIIMWLLFNWIAQTIKYLNKQTQNIWKTIVAVRKKSKNVLWKKVYKNLWLTVSQGRAEHGGVWGGGGCNTPPLFWNLSVFWQNVSVKFPEPMLSVNLEYFIIKNDMHNSINIQSRRNQTFTGDDGF